jgi:hypothetical protein
LEAQKASVEAQKIASHSLNWTIRGFVASVVFSVASILMTLFNQNTVSIEEKQAKQFKAQIEKLTQKLDSLQKSKK